MSRNGGGAENDSKTHTSGKEIETIYCRQLSVIKLIPCFPFLTVRKPYVPGRGERWKRLSLLTGPWLSCVV